MWDESDVPDPNHRIKSVYISPIFFISNSRGLWRLRWVRRAANCPLPEIFPTIVQTISTQTPLCHPDNIQTCQTTSSLWLLCGNVCVCVLYGHQVIIHRQMGHYLLLLAPSVSFPSFPPQKHLFYVDVKVSVQPRAAVSPPMRSMIERKRLGWGWKGWDSPQILGSEVKWHQHIMVYCNHESQKKHTHCSVRQRGTEKVVMWGNISKIALRWTRTLGCLSRKVNESAGCVFVLILAAPSGFSVIRISAEATVNTGSY